MNLLRYCCNKFPWLCDGCCKIIVLNFTFKIEFLEYFNTIPPNSWKCKLWPFIPPPSENPDLHHCTASWLHKKNVPNSLTRGWKVDSGTMLVLQYSATWCGHVVRPRVAVTWCSHVIPRANPLISSRGLRAWPSGQGGLKNFNAMYLEKSTFYW